MHSYLTSEGLGFLDNWASFAIRNKIPPGYFTTQHPHSKRAHILVSTTLTTFKSIKNRLHKILRRTSFSTFYSTASLESAPAEKHQPNQLLLRLLAPRLNYPTLLSILYLPSTYRCKHQHPITATLLAAPNQIHLIACSVHMSSKLSTTTLDLSISTHTHISTNYVHIPHQISRLTSLRPIISQAVSLPVSVLRMYFWHGAAVQHPWV